MTSDDVARLRQVGFSQSEVMELLAQGDLALVFNSITKTLRVPIDDEYLNLRALPRTEKKAA